MFKIGFRLRKDLYVNDFFVPHFNQTYRGHKYKVYLPIAKSAARFHYFSYRTINAWNGLSAETTDFSSLARFRSSLVSHDLIRFCKVCLA